MENKINPNDVDKLINVNAALNDLIDDLETNIVQLPQGMDAKLDEIFKLLNEIKDSLSIITENTKKEETLEDDAKNTVRNFMLEHCNIRWLDDDIEGDIYDFLIENLFAIIKKVL